MKSALFKSVSLIALFATAPLLFPTQGMAASKKESQQKDPVVATVNGQDILLSEVLKLKKALPEKYQSLPQEKLLTLLTRELIDTALIDAAAEAALGTLTPEQKQAMDKAIARATKDLHSQFYLASMIKKELTNDKIQEAYKKIVDNFPASEERNLSHIVVADKKTAEAIIKALKSGQDFKKLAQAKSTDNTGQKGGELGFFQKEELPKELGELAFSLEIGGYSPTPVETKFGWHVLKVTQKRQATPPSLEEAKHTIEEALSQEAIVKLLEGLSAKAKITLFDKNGNPIPAGAAQKAKEKPAAAEKAADKPAAAPAAKKAK